MCSRILRRCFALLLPRFEQGSAYRSDRPLCCADVHQSRIVSIDTIFRIDLWHNYSTLIHSFKKKRLLAIEFVRRTADTY